MEGNRERRAIPGNESYTQAARLYRIRRESMGFHDPETQASIAQHEKDIQRLLRMPGEHVANPSDFAPAMADLAGLSMKHEDARRVFLDAGAKLHPEVTREASGGIAVQLEKAIALLAESDEELAHRLRVAAVSAKRRSPEDQRKIITSWAALIANRADHAAHEAAVEFTHGKIDADTRAEVHHDVAYEVHAVYVLEHLQDMLRNAEAPEAGMLVRAKEMTNFSLDFLRTRLSSSLPVPPNLVIAEDVVRWSQLAEGLNSIRLAFQKDKDASRKKAEYRKRVEDLFASLLPIQ